MFLSPVLNLLKEERVKSIVKPNKILKKKVLFDRKNNKQRQKKIKKEKGVDEEDHCLVCWEEFQGDGKKWVQCTRCRKGAHEACTDGNSIDVKTARQMIKP